MKEIGHVTGLATSTVTPGLTVLNGLPVMTEWTTGLLYIENMYLDNKS